MKFNLRGLLQDEEFLVAAGLLQQGSQGKGIGEAFFPAITQAGQVKKLFQPTAKKTKAARHAVTGADIWATEKEIADSNGILIPIPKKEIANWKALDETDIETYNFITSENYGNYLKSDTGDLKLIPTRKKDNKNVTYRPLNEKDMAVWGIDEKNVDKYQIDNNNKLSLIPVEKTKDNFEILSKDEAISEGLDVSNNQIYQKNTNNNKIIPLNTKVDRSTNVSIKMPKNKLLNKEAEIVGGYYGDKFIDIMERSDKAFHSNQNLTLLLQAADGMQTGKFAPLIKDIMEWGRLVDLDLSWLSEYGSATDQLRNADVINVLSGEQLFNKIAQTKGSVSDKEMDAFGKMTTSLAMTPDGIKSNIRIMEAMNDREILMANMAEEWTAGEDGQFHSLTKRKEVVTADGSTQKLTFKQYWMDYVHAKDANGEVYNPLFNKEELNEMLSLAESNLELMAQEGSAYQFIQGLNGGKGGYIFIYDEELYNSSNGIKGVKILETMK